MHTWACYTLTPVLMAAFSAQVRGGLTQLYFLVREFQALGHDRQLLAAETMREYNEKVCGATDPVCDSACDATGAGGRDADCRVALRRALFAAAKLVVITAPPRLVLWPWPAGPSAVAHGTLGRRGACAPRGLPACRLRRRSQGLELRPRLARHCDSRTVDLSLVHVRHRHSCALFARELQVGPKARVVWVRHGTYGAGADGGSRRRIQRSHPGAVL